MPTAMLQAGGSMLLMRIMGFAVVLARWTYLFFVNFLIFWLLLPHLLNGSHLAPISFAIYEFFFYLSLFCCFRVAVANPGFLKELSEVQEKKDSVEICEKCSGLWKPARAHHCRVCARCIFRMDHHCFWINNCVGLLNQKFFVLFLFYSIIEAILAFILLLGGILISFNKAHTKGGALVLVSILFSFALKLTEVYICWEQLCYQFEAIKTNITCIELLQGLRGPKTSFMQQVSEVFGNDWRTWILPIAPKIQLNLWEECYNDDGSPEMVPCFATGSRGDCTKPSVLHGNRASNEVSLDITPLLTMRETANMRRNSQPIALPRFTGSEDLEDYWKSISSCVEDTALD